MISGDVHSHEVHKDVPVHKDETIKTETSSDHHSHGHSHNVSDNHNLIGVTLVIGFIFMLLVDQLGGGHVHAPTGKN